VSDALPAAELVPVFSAEFPAYTFRRFQTHRGDALHAVKVDPAAPGVAEVITADPGEMRQVLTGGGEP
jgi:hypothetical protein